MPITRQTVSGKASKQSFQRGEDIHLYGKNITQFAVEEEMNFEEIYRVTAKVKGSFGEEYSVSAKIDEKYDEIFDVSCECRAFEAYEGICKHSVAVILKYIGNKKLQELQKNKQETEKNRLAKKIIYAYTMKNSIPFLEDGADGTIDLLPILKKEYSGMQLEFKIGGSQKYVLKDLIQFCNALKNHTKIAYGKKLEFIHHRDSFTETARPLVDFIMEKVEEYQHYYTRNTGSFWGYGRTKPMRELSLTPSSLENFLNLMIGQEIRLESEYGKPRTVFLADRNPELVVRMTKISGYIRISMKEVLLLSGISHCFLLIDCIMYKCTKDFTDAMKDFIVNMQQAEDGNMLLTQKDMSLFCANVLQTIKPYVKPEIENLDLNEYMPPDAEIKIYLDCMENNIITCSLAACYGEDSFNLIRKFDITEQYRDLRTEAKAVRTANKFFKKTDKNKEQLLIENNDEALYLLIEKGIEEFQEIGEVFVSEKLKRVKISYPPAISVGVSVKSELLELDIESNEITNSELLELLKNYRQKKKFYRLKNGEFIKLEDTSLETVAELEYGLHIKEKDIKKGKILVPAFRAIYVDSVLKAGQEGLNIQIGKEFKALIRNIKSMEESDFEIPSSLQKVLREYQKTGYLWIRTLASLGFGGILADDMGLGKTIQVISVLLAESEESDTRKTSLIVCPASLVYNWENELEQFAPVLKKELIVGTAEERKRKLDSAGEYDVLITSYDLIKRDVELYRNIKFEYQFIDEAQFIKNHMTQAAKAVKEMHARHKFALTGTPIENRLSELWSIYDYLMPGLLYSYRRFKEEYEQPIVQNNEEEILKRLKRMIKPFILRRIKADVLKDLPDKLENIIYSKFEEEQANLYFANAAKLQRSLQEQSDKEFKTGKLQILAELTRLRQICCSPRLVYDNYKGASAKTDTAMELIRNAVLSGHKMLVFSQFTSMLDLLALYLKKERIGHYLLKGSTSKEKRAELVADFNINEIPVFLISLKAGGTGLNLTGADMVIHYDPWWNLAAQNQATDRVYRIGQKNKVTVFKLIAKNTIEEKILKLQEKKKNLADSIVSEDGISAGMLTKEDLLDILEP